MANNSGKMKTLTAKLAEVHKLAMDLDCPEILAVLRLMLNELENVERLFLSKLVCTEPLPAKPKTKEQSQDKTDEHDDDLSTPKKNKRKRKAIEDPDELQPPVLTPQKLGKFSSKKSSRKAQASHNGPAYPPPLSPRPGTEGTHPDGAVTQGARERRPPSWLQSFTSCLPTAGGCQGREIGQLRTVVRPCLKSLLTNPSDASNQGTETAVMATSSPMATASSTTTDDVAKTTSSSLATGHVSMATNPFWGTASAPRTLNSDLLMEHFTSTKGSDPSLVATKMSSLKTEPVAMATSLSSPSTPVPTVIKDRGSSHPPDKHTSPGECPELKLELTPGHSDGETPDMHAPVVASVTVRQCTVVPTSRGKMYARKSLLPARMGSSINQRRNTMSSTTLEKYLFSSPAINVDEEPSQKPRKPVHSAGGTTGDLNGATQSAGGSTGDLNRVTQSAGGSTGDLNGVTQSAGGSTGDLNGVTPLAGGSTGDLNEVTPLAGGSTGDLNGVTQSAGGSTGDLSRVTQSAGGSTGDLNRATQSAGGSTGDLNRATQSAGGSTGDLNGVTQSAGGSTNDLNRASQSAGGSTGDLNRVTQSAGGSTNDLKQLSLNQSADGTTEDSNALVVSKSAGSRTSDFDSLSQPAGGSISLSQSAGGSTVLQTQNDDISHVTVRTKCSTPLATPLTTPIKLRKPPSVSLVDKELIEANSNFRQNPDGRITIINKQRGQVVAGGKVAYGCRYCGKLYLNLEQCEDHELSHPFPGMQCFKCTTCGKAYSFRSTAKAHFKRVHQPPGVSTVTKTPQDPASSAVKKQPPTKVPGKSPSTVNQVKVVGKPSLFISLTNKKLIESRTNFRESESGQISVINRPKLEIRCSDGRKVYHCRHPECGTGFVNQESCEDHELCHVFPKAKCFTCAVGGCVAAHRSRGEARVHFRACHSTGDRHTRKRKQKPPPPAAAVAVSSAKEAAEAAATVESITESMNSSVSLEDVFK